MRNAFVEYVEKYATAILLVLPAKYAKAESVNRDAVVTYRVNQLKLASMESVQVNPE